jgi:quinolinate synthase
MAMNAVQGVVAALESGLGEVQLDEPVRSQALGCIDRMLAFVKANPGAIAQPKVRAPIQHLGAA